MNRDACDRRLLAAMLAVSTVALTYGLFITNNLWRQPYTNIALVSWYLAPMFLVGVLMWLATMTSTRLSGGLHCA